MMRELFKVGAHFGFSRRRRHPSTSPFIVGFKNKNAVINLEETIIALDAATDMVKKLASENKTILFVGNKPEVREIVKRFAQNLESPYVAERWIGGTFTNFSEIKKRVNRLATITEQEKKGELGKYTKKERGVIAKEKRDLERYFAGIATMNTLPAALVLIDPLSESIAVAEATQLRIPIIALCGSDCNIDNIACPVVANDSQVASITYFLKAVSDAYKEGLKLAAEKRVEVPVEVEAAPVE
jgi:small subunit ribosomal protein S2